jgi:hypothetical protein
VLFSVIAIANVSHLSVLAQNSGIKVSVLLVHHVIWTLLPEAEICVFWYITLPLFGELIIIVFSPSRNDKERIIRNQHAILISKLSNFSLLLNLCRFTTSR